MSRHQTDNWRAPQDPQTSPPHQPGPGRGRRKGEYWTSSEQHQIDENAVKQYKNKLDVLETNAELQNRQTQSIDAHTLVVQNHAYAGDRLARGKQQQALNRQAGSNFQTSSLQNLPLPQQPGSRDNSARTSRPYSTSSQTRRSVASSARYNPYRLNHKHRTSNSAQQPQQNSPFSPRGETDNPPPTFTRQIPFHPTNGIGKARGQQSLRSQRVPPVRHDSHILPSIPTSQDALRFNQGRRNTPRNYRPRGTRVVEPPLAPIATRNYLNQAHIEPATLSTPKRLLVILDLNGTLMLKPDYRNPQDIRVRPGAPQLLDYLFENHNVMVYTSAQPHNGENVARLLFSRKQYNLLAGIWARDKLDLTTAQYHEKVQVYKKLDKVWATNEIQASYFPPGQGRWDQTNTILVDDSHLKALQEPHNLVQVPEFTNEPGPMMKRSVYEKKEKEILQSLILKLEALKWQQDVSQLIFRWQTGRADIPRLPGSSKVSVDEKHRKTADHHLHDQAERDLEAARNLPTPESMPTTDDEGNGSDSDDAGVPLSIEKIGA